MKDLNRVQALYELLLELPVSQRSSFLDLACEGDAELKAAVQKLLAVPTDAKTILDRPLQEEPALIGKSLGDYRIVKELGQGGMGRVFLAEQEAPISRQVAIKFVAFWGLNSELRRRFHLEQLNLARMNHPYIAQLYDSGLTPDGQPYFVMEYLEGEPITAYCNRRQLNLTQRIDLFTKVCEGVSHAHLKGVIHRDLKPSNVLIVEKNGDPIPKIIDFGIAKNLDQTALTHTGQRPGSYCYMSPEQAGAPDEEGRPRDQDFRSDIYALAAILYELMVGDPPLTWDPGEPATKILSDICEKPPKKPSLYWESLSAQEQTRRAGERSMAVSAVVGQLRGDLDWILVKALEKSPNRRYRSTDHLIEEIHRYRNHRPVDAGPPTLSYLLSKMVQRHRRAVMMVVAAGVLLLGFTAVILWQNSVIANERDHARQEALTAEEVTDFLVSILTAGDPYSAENPVGINNLKVQEVVDRARDEIKSRFEAQPKTKALILEKLGDVYLSWGQRQDALDLYLESLEIMTKLETNTGEKVTELTGLVGKTHARIGNFKQAIPLLEQVIGRNKSQQGPDAAELAGDLNHLADIYIVRNNWARALSLAEESLSISLKHHGPLNPMVGWAHNSLGRIHRNTGRYALAIRHFEKALYVLTQMEGEEHPQRADVLNNLAMAYLSSGDFSKAESLLQEAMDLDIAIHGYEHPFVSIDLMGLGDVYRMMGQANLAESYYRESLALKHSLGGDQHPGTGIMLYHFANLIREENPLEALHLLRQALAIAEHAFPQHHVQRADALHAMAVTYNHLADYQRALPLIEQAHAIFASEREKQLQYFYSSTRTKARTLMGMACFAHAETLLLDALETAKTTKNPDEFTHVPQLLFSLMDLYQAWQQPQKADQVRLRLAQTSFRIHGPL